jgi:hypothetical protein
MHDWLPLARFSSPRAPMRGTSRQPRGSLVLDPVEAVRGAMPGVNCHRESSAPLYRRVGSASAGRVCIGGSGLRRRVGSASAGRPRGRYAGEQVSAGSVIGALVETARPRENST